LARTAALKKLCNHPKLIYDMISSSTENASAADGFKDCGQFFQPVLPRCPSALHARRLISCDIPHRACSTMAAPAAARRRPDGRSTGACPRYASACQRAFPSDAPLNNACACSGKFLVLARLLDHLRQNTTDRIVLVSNYTQTLDLFQNFCRERCAYAIALQWQLRMQPR
jgi:DNA repair and recombination RAD54-like protein